MRLLLRNLRPGDIPLVESSPMYGEEDVKYNLIVMLAILAIDVMSDGSENLPILFLLMLVPFLLISSMFPVVILADSQKDRFRKNLWETMKKLNMNKRFVSENRLEPAEDYEDL